MSAGVNIQITDATARRTLEGLAAKITPPGRKRLNAVLGRAAKRTLRRHFAWADSAKANQQGFKRQHFWARIRSATAYDAALTTDSSATVVISDPRAKGPIFGGTWGAKESKYLAIPVNPRAAGIRPSANLIPNVHFMPSKRAGNVAGWLFTTTGKGKSAKITFLWRLQKRVTVRRDPTALPTPERMGADLVYAATEFLTPGTA